MGIFDNPLGNMYGPYFLVLYAVFIAIIAIGIWTWKKFRDRTGSLNLPPIPASVDPFEAAWLRGGDNELARTAVFGLIHRGLAQIDSTGSRPLIRQTGAPRPVDLSKIERDTLSWIGSERKPEEFFKSGGLASELARHSQAFGTRLERLQLINGQSAIAAFSPYRWMAILAIIGLGAYKITAALTNGRSNIGFLVMIGIVGVVITWSVSKLPRLTQLGESYLNQLQFAFGSVRANPSQFAAPPRSATQAGSAGIDPMLLSVGVFGTGILAGSVYGDYNDAFRKAQSSGSCGSACGTGSDSSGDGGGSCGSGCGGCGGGGD